MVPRARELMAAHFIWRMQVRGSLSTSCSNNGDDRVCSERVHRVCHSQICIPVAFYVFYFLLATFWGGKGTLPTLVKNVMNFKDKTEVSKEKYTKARGPWKIHHVVIGCIMCCTGSNQFSTGSNQFSTQKNCAGMLPPWFLERQRDPTALLKNVM
jgi:hypothetical protein